MPLGRSRPDVLDIGDARILTPATEPRVAPLPAGDPWPPCPASPWLGSRGHPVVAVSWIRAGGAVRCRRRPSQCHRAPCPSTARTSCGDGTRNAVIEKGTAVRCQRSPSQRITGRVGRPFDCSGLSGSGGSCRAGSPSAGGNGAGSRWQIHTSCEPDAATSRSGSPRSSTGDGAGLRRPAARCSRPPRRRSGSPVLPTAHASSAETVTRPLSWEGGTGLR